MGDSTAGAGAAQHASDPEETGSRGFFGRILDALKDSDAGEEAAEAEEPRSSAGTAPAARAVARLRGLRVEDVAVPKAEIVAVPVEIGLEGLVAVFRESGFSRLPVYRGTLDRPQGLVLLKDLALEYGFGAVPGAFSLKRLMRPVIHVPPSMPLSVLLQKMQAERAHMALVIDEYGGVDGLVTIEDLLEEVVGEIDDEHDTGEAGLWVEEKPGVYLAQARTPLDEFEEKIGVRLADEEEEEEIDTLGGLVFVLTGRVPARGEVVTHANGTEFEIVDADARRVKRLRVRLPDARAA
ncbi:MAG: HlyC/CorC family transporter [Rhodobacteraceae bacterium]|nr:HlyC/CorC family transporter [Paracoccaceae bacterium]